jgi:hypothetical protein
MSAYCEYSSRAQPYGSRIRHEDEKTPDDGGSARKMRNRVAALDIEALHRLSAIERLRVTDDVAVVVLVGGGPVAPGLAGQIKGT